MRDFCFSRHVPNATDATDQVIGPLPFACKVLSVRGRYRTPAASGGSPELDIKRVPDGTAVGSGTSVLSAAIQLESTKATQTLTSTGVAPSDGHTVTIGSTVYTFKTALTAPAVPFEVLIGVSAAVALDNLKSAINASAGAGTVYGTGTTAHPTVTATTNTDTTQLIEAITSGTAANSIATTETSATLSWGAATMTGGKGQAADVNFTATLASDRALARGDSLGLDFSGTLTNLVDLDLLVTVHRTSAIR